MDFDVQTILFDEVPQLFSILQELLAGSDVVEQRSAQELDVLR